MGESSQREILVLPVSRPSCSLSSAKILAVDEILADIVWGGGGMITSCSADLLGASTRVGG